MSHQPDRRSLARAIRDEASEFEFLRPFPHHVNNGEESDYRGPDNHLNYIANYSKGLPHKPNGEVDPEAYRTMLQALTSRDPHDFEQISLGDPGPDPGPAATPGPVANYGWFFRPSQAATTFANRGRGLTSPQAGLAFDLEGPDGQALTLPPAPRIDGPENSAEMGELYWMALLRDTEFNAFEGDALAQQAADSLSDEFSDFRGPKVGGRVTPATLFRGITQGDLVGPYISQFLVRGAADGGFKIKETDGYIVYGALRIDQRQKTAKKETDYLTDFDEWLAVQNGADRRNKDAFEDQPRFIATPRDLATYVHFDFLYEAYLNACMLLLDMKAPFDAGNPYTDSKSQEGFATFGGPHILTLVTEVATRALKAAWFQKWFVHRRLRPEAFGGLVHNVKYGTASYPINQEILNSSVLSAIEARFKSYLLPQAFPEGSPTHPAYGAGHATVAGACVTILKAWFDESFVIPDPVIVAYGGTSLSKYIGQPLTVGGELNKVAANIASGRNMGGVHWRTDFSKAVLLGEAIAIGILQDQANCYNEDFRLSLTKFDGTTITITKP